jgi:RES domain-containing protein
LLEVLAHASIGRIPTTHRFVVVEVPRSVSVEIPDPNSLPAGWDAERSGVARAFGDRWLEEARSAILVVPSVVARIDHNALVNPAHPDARLLIPSPPQANIWDRRLFARSKRLR